jgi:zinc protease
MRRLFVPVLIALLANIGQPAARGQSKPDLPKADTVMSQYIEATGGETPRKKLTNRVSTGTIELKGANIKGTIKVTEAPPNKVLLVTKLGPIGESKQGTDGKDAWEVSSINGDRDLDGEEKETFIREAGFFKDLNWKEIYDKVECVGVEDVDGKPAHKIVLTPKTGKPITQFFDKTSHLLVKQATITATPMGETPVEVYPSDYKDVDGVKIPFTLTQKVLTQEIVITLTEIKHNVEVPADTFRRPAAADEPAKKKAE